MNFLAKSNGKRGEIYIYDAIGAGFFGDGVSAKSFAESMKALGAVRALDIYVNSPGGSVFDGVAIYNQIRRFEGEKVVHIDGIAASIASVIALAGDERRIAANGTVMIHNPYGITAGGADDMRKYADSLDKIRDTIVQTYADRTGGNAKQLQEWMDAETWMDATEAVERGFATAITEDKAIKAEFPMLAKFNNVPDRLRAQATGSSSLLSRMSMRVQSMNLRASPGAA